MSHLVCQTCWTNVFNNEALQDFWTRGRDNFIYETTWHQVALSTEQSCNWCGFLKSVLPQPGNSMWPSHWAMETILSVEISEAYLMDDANPKGLNHCQIDFASTDSSRDWHAEFDMTIDNPSDSFHIVTARPIQRKLDTPTAYQQIKQWLQQCQEHPTCSVSSTFSSSQVPSRLIEVSPQNPLNDPRIRPTNGLEASYLALSYCWGTDEFYTLNKSNIQGLSEAINLHRLPETIRDAFEITRKLGFRYLWVDSLCIIQDSEEDKTSQLSIMHSIYANAEITIVAACSEKVADGFLGERDVSQKAQFRIPCCVNPEHRFIVHINEHDMYDNRLEPVNIRAWTYQEALLSPRLLIYASHTLQWNCRTLTCNLDESYHSPNPSATPRLPDIKAFATFYDNPGANSTFLQPEDVPHPILQSWLKFVAAYSSRKLSLPRDKLVAISALAEWFRTLFGHRYHAGLWEKSPVQQLCWRSPHKHQSFTKPATYRAPSWSWAALDGTIYFPSYLQSDRGTSVCIRHPGFRIIEWKTELKASNVTYGEVTGGELIAEANIIDATFDLTSQPNLLFPGTQTTTLRGNRVIATPQAFSDTGEDNFARSVRCLALYVRDGSQEPLVGGLMLINSTTHIGCYQRIGTFVADSVVFSHQLLHTVTIV